MRNRNSLDDKWETSGSHLTSNDVTGKIVDSNVAVHKIHSNDIGAAIRTIEHVQSKKMDTHTMVVYGLGIVVAGGLIIYLVKQKNQGNQLAGELLGDIKKLTDIGTTEALKISVPKILLPIGFEMIE